MAIFDKLKKGLQKTRNGFTDQLKSILNLNKGMSEELIEEIEEILITGDIGVDITLSFVEKLREVTNKEKDLSYDKVVTMLKTQIIDELKPIIGDFDPAIMNQKPHVILVVGVNGTGKTTTIGKLANYYKNLGKKVMLCAGDTFRAAAIDQLEVWTKRIGVEIIKNTEGTDPAAVAFDSLHSAIAKDADVLIVDTAGRIHTNVNLMGELEKIKRVLGKVMPDAPHQTYLVIDGNTGQNAIAQAKIFTSHINVDGLVVTKLDGTAKGGAAIPIIKELNIPIKFIGIGEQKDDIQVFNIEDYINALFI